MSAPALPNAPLHLSHGERSDREAIRVRGYGLSKISEPPHANPLPNGERERARYVATRSSGVHP
jgi:hypothetical protein